MSDYVIGRSAGVCATCGNQIEAEANFFSALFEIRDGFDRRDYCAACWSGPPADAFCHYRSRLPRRTEKRRLLVSDDALLAFFDRLGETADDALKRDFRFVLALVLMRKRLLKYERTEREGQDEYWVVRMSREQREQRVLDPRLDDARITLLTGEIGAILSGQTAAGEDDNDAISTIDSVEN